MSKKIIIVGFPHSGTSILKSIIGHIEDVDELDGEGELIDQSSDKKYILCKRPFYGDFVPETILSDVYEDYIKIYIVRNPLWVYSSLRKRFPGEVGGIPDGDHPHSHAVEKCSSAIKFFIKYKNNPIDDLHLIRYEDLFYSNYENLKYILDKIGFRYTDDIFDNSKYDNRHIDVISPYPRGNVHRQHRTRQINQPFENFNKPEKLDLWWKDLVKIQTDGDILSLYPEITHYRPS